MIINFLGLLPVLGCVVFTIGHLVVDIHTRVRVDLYSLEELVEGLKFGFYLLDIGGNKC